MHNIEHAKEEWQKISTRLDDVQNVFYNKLKDAIFSTVSSNQVSLNVNRKTFESAYEKCLSKNKTFDQLTDLLRAKILYSRRVDPEKIINGIEKQFGRSNIVIDRRDTPRPGREYFGVTHIDINVDGIICEVQLLRKNLQSYVDESRKFYKTPTGERVKNLSQREKNIEKTLFEIGNRPQNIMMRQEFDNDIDSYASLIAAIKLFYKIAAS